MMRASAERLALGGDHRRGRDPEEDRRHERRADLDERQRAEVDPADDEGTPPRGCAATRWPSRCGDDRRHEQEREPVAAFSSAPRLVGLVGFVFRARRRARAHGRATTEPIVWRQQQQHTRPRRRGYSSESRRARAGATGAGPRSRGRSGRGRIARFASCPQELSTAPRARPSRFSSGSSHALSRAGRSASRRRGTP